MTKYAAYFLGLLLAGQAYAYDDCYNWECEKARSYREQAAIRAERQASEQEERDSYRRSQPVLVVEPDRSFIAYPSSDGRSVNVYGGLGRGFDRE